MFAFLAAIPFVSTILGFFTGGTGLLAGLSSLLSVLAKGAIDLFGWYLSEFYKGMGVILGNLSTLVVIITLMIGSNYYTKIRTEKVEQAEFAETQKAFSKAWKCTVRNPKGASSAFRNQ